MLNLDIFNLDVNDLLDTNWLSTYTDFRKVI